MQTTTDAKTPFGAGLPVILYSAVVAFSIALFLAWGGLLWQAPREASHVGRFIVSYVAVIPAAAVLLAALHRFSWGHLITATGTVWAIKLVITSVLYLALARGTAVQLNASVPSQGARAAAEAAPDYHPAPPGFAAGSLQGRVRVDGAPARGALVYLEAPAPGRALDDARPAALVIEASRYERPIYVASTANGAVVLNKDAVLHTVHLYRDRRGVVNEPLPASMAPHALRLPDEGVYRIRCDNHPDETATLIIVDHPYATFTDERGEFVLSDIAAGETALVALAHGSQVAFRGRAAARVEPGRTTAVSVELSREDIE